MSSMSTDDRPQIELVAINCLAAENCLENKQGAHAVGRRWHAICESVRIREWTPPMGIRCFEHIRRESTSAFAQPQLA